MVEKQKTHLTKLRYCVIMNISIRNSSFRYIHSLLFTLCDNEDVNLNSNVSIAIRESLLSNDGNFHKKNRGMLLSAEGLNYNKNTNEVTLYFTDFTQHGNLDGGHTYSILKKHKGATTNQFVRIEVMTGVEEIIEQLAEARNTSVQVDEKSMAELQDKFDPIKEGLEGMQFFQNIAFRQNQVNYDEDNNRIKMIDAREVVALISMFNPLQYDENHQPTQAYSSKAAMLRKYLDNSEQYRKFVNIMPDIFELYDAIECDFAGAYNVQGGKYGRKKYSGYRDGNIVNSSKFGYHDMQYRIPDGLIYPIVAAFRSLVIENDSTNKYEWVRSPLEVWETIKNQMVGTIMNYANTIGDNPNRAGKDTNIWQLAYLLVVLQKNN